MGGKEVFCLIFAQQLQKYMHLSYIHLPLAEICVCLFYFQRLSPSCPRPTAPCKKGKRYLSLGVVHQRHILPGYLFFIGRHDEYRHNHGNLATFASAHKIKKGGRTHHCVILPEFKINYQRFNYKQTFYFLLIYTFLQITTDGPHLKAIPMTDRSLSTATIVRACASRRPSPSSRNLATTSHTQKKGGRYRRHQKTMGAIHNTAQTILTVVPTCIHLAATCYKPSRLPIKNRLRYISTQGVQMFIYRKGSVKKRESGSTRYKSANPSF